jgi:hypothetical protein
MSWASKGFMGVSWNAPITKGYRAYKERGLRGMITQLYLVSEKSAVAEHLYSC